MTKSATTPPKTTQSSQPADAAEGKESSDSKRVLVAMSGGVDSSVAAALLKTQGYEVVGLYMQLWDTEDNPYPVDDGGSCGKAMDLQYVKAVCKQLEISLHIVNARDQYQNDVVNPMVNDILMGRKFNPCMACNSRVKLKLLFKKANELKCHWIATGHYVRKVRELAHDEYHLYKASDHDADQSFYFFEASQEILSRLITPLGDLLQSYVTTMARTFYLPAIARPKRKQLCFVEDLETTKNFLMQRVPDYYRVGGPYHNVEGSVIGRHRGIYKHRFGRKDEVDVPAAKEQNLTVVGFELGSNTIVLGTDAQLPRANFVVSQCNWVGELDLRRGFRGNIRLDPYSELLECTFTAINNNSVLVKFEKPQYKVLPGQAVAFYMEEQLIGGGWIETMELPKVIKPQHKI